MGKKIELSIIIPNYNGIKDIDNCINSILKQTFSNYEIIICDDCSTDNSVEIIQQYVLEHSFINAIFHKKNLGLPMNRNSGILKAKGLYITTLDQDDVYYDKRKLEKEMNIVKYYLENENKIVCAFSKIALLDKDLNYIRDQWPESNILEGYIFKEIISRSAMIPRDYIVAKEAYQTVGLYDKLALYEDWDLKIRQAHKYEFYFTDIYGTGYVRHGHGLSNVTIPKNIEALKKVFIKNFHLVSDGDKVEVVQSFSEFIDTIRRKFIGQLEKQISSNNEIISQKNNQIKQQEEKLANKNISLKNKNQQIIERDEQLAEINTIVSQKNNQIKLQKEELVNKNTYLKNKNKQIIERDKQLAKKNELLIQKSHKIKDRDKQINQKEEQLKVIEKSFAYKVLKFIFWPIKKIDS